MSVAVTRCAGLPPYGPLARGFPAHWGALGREGVVVEFRSEAGSWIGNFAPGEFHLDLVAVHPNGRDAVVVSRGNVFVVDVAAGTAECVDETVAALEVSEPPGWVFDSCGLSLFRLGPDGIMWRTPRISWDGFEALEVRGDEVVGLCWDISDSWLPFRVCLRTGDVISCPTRFSEP